MLDEFCRMRVGRIGDDCIDPPGQHSWWLAQLQEVLLAEAADVSRKDLEPAPAQRPHHEAFTSCWFPDDCRLLVPPVFGQCWNQRLGDPALPGLVVVQL